MNSKTKIMVFRMRELIYTGIFALLFIALVLLLILMFKPKTASAPQEKDASVSAGAAIYTPGVYTTPITLNDSAIDVEVTLDTSSILSIRLVNLSETVQAMYPLVQPALDELADQIYESQSTDQITYSEDSKYTSSILLKAIQDAVALGTITPES